MYRYFFKQKSALVRIVAVLAVCLASSFAAQVYLPNFGVVNQGVSFNLLARVPAQVIALSTLVGLLVVSFLCREYIDFEREGALLVGGGSANILERFMYGGVYDWIPLPFGLQANGADLCINVALIWIIAHIFRQEFGQNEKVRSHV